MFETNISIVTVFMEGLLSFFSPCVLPLLPVYIGYLSGGTMVTLEDGRRLYDRRKVLMNTFFFVLGISFAFFVLGFGISLLGRFFSGNQLLFARIGGVIVILFGLYQLGFLGSSRLLDGEHRLPFTFDTMRMSPWTALAMGFVISFAWSPCIGPMLSSVLILAATSGGAGFLYIGVYTLGYILPFLVTGLFTTTLLDFFGKNRGVVKYTAKIGGVLMIVMGILMISGKMNGISSYLSRVSAPEQEVVAEADGEEIAGEESSDGAEESQGQVLPAPEFTLTDQYGQVHSLADYRGKVVFLNFWATWCPPCREEMPYIQELYEEYAAEDDPEVAFLSVAFPNVGNEQDVEGIKAFLEEHGYTYPVLMDEEATLALPYYITAYPTTFLINSDGEVLFYIPGGMTKETMQEAIRQALEQSK